LTVDSSKAKRAEALRLLQAGHSQTRTATLVGCSRSSVQRWREAALAAGVTGLAAKTGRPRRKNRRAGKQAAPIGGDIGRRIADLDIPADLVEVRSRWLPNARRLVDEALSHGDSVAARDWIRIYIETAERLIAATPPPLPDPEDDPANVAARGRVRAKLTDVASTVARKLCAPCRGKLGLAVEAGA
jgi:hypothetical protein